MPLSQVNWLAVLVAAILNMILGMAWYSPVLFGNTWLRLIDKKVEDIPSPGMVYVFTFVGYLVAASVLAVIVKALGSPTLLDGTLAGLVVWLGFVVTMTYTYTSFEGPNKRVWALYIGYQLVAFVGMGALFAVWK
jgi:hypothetical protein